MKSPITGPSAILAAAAVALALLAFVLLRMAVRAGGRGAGLRLGFAGTAGALALVLGFAAARGDRRDLRYFATDGSGSTVRPFEHLSGLGAMHAPAQRVRAIKGEPGRPMYDVVYTIDGFGNRVAPSRPDQPAVVFFGCSFTFGDGVEDEGTMPWQFAQAIDGRLDVVNAGHSGQGAHQMLRILETDRLARRLPHGIARAFYTAIRVHPARAAGLAPWDLLGPRYEVASGVAAYRGPFHSRLGALLIEGGQYLFGGRWLPPWEDHPLDTPRDEERWAGVVARSAEILRDRWGAPLTVVLWDQDPPGKVSRLPLDASVEHMAGLLTQRGIGFVRISDILPSGKGPPELIRGDWHPTPATNGRIARALAARFFPPDAPEAGALSAPAP